MRSAERDVLLFILAVTAGCADGWSYVGLGHAFVANMTGNTVLLGLAVSQKHGDLLHPFISLSCYAGGVAIASFFTRHDHPGAVWSKAVSRILMLEALLMSGAEIGWVAIHRMNLSNAIAPRDLNLLLGCVALAIGLQSGAMLQLKVPGIVTTYITGTWTNLVRGLVSFSTRKQRQPRSQKLQFEERLLMQAGVLAVYFCSAMLTGWLFRHMLLGVGALSAACVLVVAVYGILRMRSADMHAKPF